jgi:glutathione synthase/RimK-type ligase-like ATP-grasp enzyme
VTDFIDEGAAIPTTQSRSPAAWVAEVEGAWRAGRVADAERLAEDIARSAGREQLFPLIYERARATMAMGELAVADGLFTWLGAMVPHDWHVHLAAAELRQRRVGVDLADRQFRAHVARHPVFRYQPARVAPAVRAATVLTLGAKPVHFEGGGFSLPEGLTEAQHLTRAERFEASMVFVEGLRDAHALDDAHIVINAISDADLYGQALRDLATHVPALRVPIINPPAAVLAATRDGLSARVRQGDGFIVPRTVRVRLPADDAYALPRSIDTQGLHYPVLARPVGTHTGEGLVRLDSAEHARAWAAKGAQREVYLTQYMDFRSPDGWWRKYRLWCVGEAVVHNHVLVGEHWNVHGNARVATMLPRPALMAEDAAYVREGLPHLWPQTLAMVQALRAATGLDYFGIDYGVTPEGELVVFEANATMRSCYLEIAGTFPHASIALERHVQAFEALVDQKLARGVPQ